MREMKERERESLRYRRIRLCIGVPFLSSASSASFLASFLASATGAVSFFVCHSCKRNLCTAPTA
jgi:hypothetical protein